MPSNRLKGARDSAIVLGMSFLNVAVSIGAQSALAWLLAPAGRGAFGVCIVFASLLAVVFSFGTDRATQYFTISERMTLAQATGAALIFTLLGSLVATACGWALINSGYDYFSKASPQNFYISLSLVPVLMLTSHLQLLLSARRRFVTAGNALVIGAVANVPLLFLFFAWMSDPVAGALYAFIVSQAIGAAYSLVASCRSSGGVVIVIPARRFKEVFDYGARFYIARLSVSVNTHLPIILLAPIATATEVGWYIAIAALVNRFFLIPNSVTQALQPRIKDADVGVTRAVEQASRFLLYSVSISFAGLYLISNSLIPLLLSADFTPAVPLLGIFGFGVVLRSATRPLLSWLIGTNKPGLSSICTAIQFVLVLMTLPIMYKSMGINGAAWSVVFAQSCEAITLILLYHKFTSSPIMSLWMPCAADIGLLRDIAKAMLKRHWSHRDKPDIPPLPGSEPPSLKHPSARELLVLDDCVVKQQFGLALEIEAEKTRIAHRLGQASLAFRSPAVIAFDRVAGTLTLEKLNDVTPIWQRLVGPGDHRNLVCQVGIALATVHNELRIDATICRPTAAEWLSGGAWPNVCIHGDFNTLNVMVSPGSDTIYVLDWSVSDICLPELGDLGPCYFDVAWFIHTMHFRQFGGLIRIRQTEKLIDSFLTGYFDTVANAATMTEFCTYLHTVYLPACARRPALNLSTWDRLMKFRSLTINPSSRSRFVSGLSGKLRAR